MKISFIYLLLIAAPFYAQKIEQPYVVNEKDLNTNYDEISVALSADGSQLFFSSNQPRTKNTNSQDFDVFSTTLKNNTWNKATNVISINTTTEEIVSNTNFAGDEIFFQTNISTISPQLTAKLAGDNWVKQSDNKSPILSTTIPFIDENHTRKTKEFILELIQLCKEDPRFINIHGDKLYFSSKGLNSLGGYDIFFSEYVDGKWSKPKNMGYPINTAYDEFSYSPVIHEKIAFLTSNRPEGVGGFDIYKVVYPSEEKFPEIEFSSYKLSSDRSETIETISQITKNKKELYYMIVTGRITNLLNLQGIEANIEVIDNENTQLINTIKSNAKTGKYTLCLTSGKNYNIRVSANGYLFQSENINLKNKGENNFKTKNFKMVVPAQENVSVLKNVFFEKNEETILPSSYAELDYIYNLLKNSNGIKIEIGSFTNNLNSLSNNLELTQKRSDAIANYLISKGINKNIIQAKGYGSKKPLYSNEIEIGRKLNERVELKILTH